MTTRMLQLRRSGPNWKLLAMVKAHMDLTWLCKRRQRKFQPLHKTNLKTIGTLLHLSKTPLTTRVSALPRILPSRTQVPRKHHTKPRLLIIVHLETMERLLQKPPTLSKCDVPCHTLARPENSVTAFPSTCFSPYRGCTTLKFGLARLHLWP